MLDVYCTRRILVNLNPIWIIVSTSSDLDIHLMVDITISMESNKTLFVPLHLIHIILHELWTQTDQHQL